MKNLKFGSFPLVDIDANDRKCIDSYMITFLRDSDQEVYRPSTTENLKAGKAFEITTLDYQDFFHHYRIILWDFLSYF